MLKAHRRYSLNRALCDSGICISISFFISIFTSVTSGHVYFVTLHCGPMRSDLFQLSAAELDKSKSFVSYCTRKCILYSALQVIRSSNLISSADFTRDIEYPVRSSARSVGSGSSGEGLKSPPPAAGWPEREAAAGGLIKQPSVGVAMTSVTTLAGVWRPCAEPDHQPENVTGRSARRRAKLAPRTRGEGGGGRQLPVRRVSYRPANHRSSPADH